MRFWSRFFRKAATPGRTIGIEERFLKVSQLKNIQRHLPDATFTDASGLVEGVAARPSEAESACLRRAARITDIGFQAGIRESRDGVYPYEVIGKIHDAMYQAGQRDFDMSLVCVWSGPQGGRMHDTSTTEKIKKGDIVTIEVWGVDNHYKAGAQASIYVGDNPPAAIVEAYDLNARMQQEAHEGGQGRRHRRRHLSAPPMRSIARQGVRTIFDAAAARWGLTVFTIDLVNGRQDVLNPGVALLIQTLVDDPVLLTCASTVMVTEQGCEELTSPLLQLRTTS